MQRAWQKTMLYLGVAAAGIPLAAPAAAQTVVTEAGTQYTTPALAGFSTQPGDMVGMVVTGYDGSGTAYSGIWGSIVGGYGVSNSLFTLSVGGDSFSSPWTVSSSSGLFSLVLSGAPGNTLFDATSSPELSPGSALGRAFDYSGSDLWSTLVTYSNQVAVGGVVYGDLYEQVTVDFTNGLTSSTQFYMDTDNARTAGTIVPDPTVAPEPLSVLLLATGLVGIAFVSRRRRIQLDV